MFMCYPISKISAAHFTTTYSFLLTITSIIEPNAEFCLKYTTQSSRRSNCFHFGDVIYLSVVFRSLEESVPMLIKSKYKR